MLELTLIRLHITVFPNLVLAPFSGVCVCESGSWAAAVSPWLPGNPGLALGVSGQGLISHHHLNCVCTGVGELSKRHSDVGEKRLTLLVTGCFLSPAVP